MRPMLAVSLAAFLVACGSSGSQSARTRPWTGPVSIETSQVGTFSLHVERELPVMVDTVPAGADRAWAGLKSVYRDLDVPVTTVNEEARVVGGVKSAPRSGSRASGWTAGCGAGPTCREA